MTGHDKKQADRSVVVGRDVINSIINTGDHNQFFIGDYEQLRDAYIEPWPVFERVDLNHFEGREWLTTEVDSFLHDHDRGYFILEAEAGLGKTTFLAWLVRERKYIHHFTELALGLDGTERGLKNLAAQITLAYLSGNEVESVLPGAAARPDYLLTLLKRAADKRQKGEKIVLVIDALDESDSLPNNNVLGLPHVLPEGVYFIVSQRPVPVRLQVDVSKTPRHLFSFTPDSDKNLDDMCRFLNKAAIWPGIARALQERNYSSEQFIEILLQKCLGVWVYLHFIVHEIEQGERSPLELGTLPNGMAQYYARYWGDRWREKDEVQWYGVYLPLLTTLAATQEPVTARRLANWTSVNLRLQQLSRLLNEGWRPFLAISGKGEQLHYRLYHATLREFLNGQVKREELLEAERSLVDELAISTREMHSRLADFYLNVWGSLKGRLPGLTKEGERDPDEQYGLRHLAMHLEASGRIDDLNNLLKLESDNRWNTWFAIKETIGDTAGYIADIARAWRCAEKAYKANDNKSSSRSIGLQIRYALITSSINSLAKNIPSSLLVVLVKEGKWTPIQGLAYANQSPNAIRRAEMLTKLAPYLTNSLRGEALKQALSAAKAIRDESRRATALSDLVPHLSERLLLEVLEAAKGMEEEYPRATVLSCLTQPESLLQKAIEMAKMIKDERFRELALWGLEPHEPLKGEALQEALEAQANKKDDYKRANALIGLAPDLPETLLQQAFVIAETINDEYWRARALVGLLPYLPYQLKKESLQQALKATKVIRVDAYQATILSSLAPYLTAPYFHHHLVQR